MARKAKAKTRRASATIPASASVPSVASLPTTPSENRWRLLFAIDARSLGLFRIILGFFLLLDPLMQLGEIATFYSDEGLLPRLSRIALYDLADTTGQKYWLSLYTLAGPVWFQEVLFGVTILFGFLLMIGYRTRLAAFVSFIMCASLQSRNPVILDGGDTLIRMLLFWSMFLPLNARFSVDRYLRPEPAAPTSIFSIGSFALLTQIGYVYTFGAILKSDPVWRSEYTALYYAVSLDCFATSLGNYLVDCLTLTKILTFFTWWLELLGPLLLLIPYGTSWLRLGVVLSFWGFHLGTDTTLHLSLFPFIGCLAWVPFLPARIWESGQWPGQKLIPLLEKIIRPIRLRIEKGLRAISPWLRNPETCAYSPGRGAKIFIGILWVYIFAWNVRETNIDRWTKVMPLSTNIVGRLLKIDQNWDLFAPAPTKGDGWYVMKGVLKDDTEVNLWDRGQPLPWKKPEDVAATYRNRRWRKYLLNLIQERYVSFRQPFALWLAVQWDEEFALINKEKSVRRVELYFQEQITPPPGQPKPKPNKIQLWEQRFGPTNSELMWEQALAP